MLSYHGDPAIKAKYLARVREHARLDQLVQGTGWANGKGCAVGCTLEAYDHSRYPIELGLPEWLAHLEDLIFEKLPWEHARTWPERFLDAIPVGVDLEPVRCKQAIWRHTHDLELLKDNAEPYTQRVREAVQGVIDYCQGMIAGTANEEQSLAAWSAATSAAWSAAELAQLWAHKSAPRTERVAAARAALASSAAWSAAWSVAGSQAEELAAMEEWAAWVNSAKTTAMSEAEAAHYIAESEHLLKLLAEAGAKSSA